MRLRAIVTDVDGTLYCQNFVRTRVAAKMLANFFRAPLRTIREVRCIQIYRQAQEIVRKQEFANTGKGQLALAATRSRESISFVQHCTGYWMEEVPMPYLRSAMRPGVNEFLTWAKRNGFRIGALSDYPARGKLRSMGLLHLMDVVIDSDSADFQLKPSPKGLERALAELDVKPNETIYVGDRVEVDGTAGERAGVRCFILNRKDQTSASIASFTELRAHLQRLDSTLGD
jgi:FMN phosphatase YigB (HAD superfamily)